MDQILEEEYIAFISYRRTDSKWAEWIQNKLEFYKLPTFVKEEVPNAPQHLRPIFRDVTDLEPGVLSEKIESALQKSRFLIVICSPQSAKSEWVEKEIREFMSQGKTAQIIPFIVDGIAHSDNPDEECLPKPLRELPEWNELVGANVAELNRDYAAVKVVATMLGIKVDKLWQRYLRAEEEEKQRILAQRNHLLSVQSYYLSEKAILLAEKGDAYTGRLLALEALPEQMETPNRPYVAEAEAALRQTCKQDSFTIRQRIHQIALNADGDLLLTTGKEYDITLWDINTGGVFDVFEGHSSNILAMSFMDDDSFISVAEDWTIRRWDAYTGSQTHILEWQTYDYDLSLFTFSPNGQLLVTEGQSDSGDVLVWDTKTGKLLNTIHADFYPLRRLLFSPDGKWLAISSDDYWNKCIMIVDLEGHQRTVLPFQSFEDAEEDFDDDTEYYQTVKPMVMPDYIEEMAFNPDGDYLAVSVIDENNKNEVQLWCLDNGKKIGCFCESKDDVVLSMAFHPDGDKLITTSISEPPKLWKIVYSPTKLDVTLLHTYENLEAHANNAMFLPNGRHLLCQYESGIRLFEWNLYPTPAESIRVEQANAIQKASNKAHLDFVSADSIVRLEDFWFLRNSAYSCTFASYSQDKKQIVSVADDGSLRIWQTDKGILLATLQSRQVSMKFAFFSTDGHYIVASYSDMMIGVWDAVAGVELLLFSAFGLADDKNLYSLYEKTRTECLAAMSEDGCHIVAFCSYSSLDYASQYKGAIVKRTWNFPPLQELINQTRQHFSHRQLTSIERNHFHLDVITDNNN